MVLLRRVHDRGDGISGGGDGRGIHQPRVGELPGRDVLGAGHRSIGHLVVESRLPRQGEAAATDYTGQGYVIVRDPATEVVRDALRRIIGSIRIELVEAL